MTAEIREALKESFLIADKFGARERLNEQIDRIIESSIVQLSNNGMLHYTNTLLGKHSGAATSATQGQNLQS